MAVRKSLYLKAALGVMLASALAGGAWRLWHDRSGKELAADAIRIDMAKPDVVILSDNLGQVPRDVLAVPLLRDLLTEDAVFYYQNAPSALSLQGTLQRLAFEHKLSLPEKLVAKLLNRNGEMYVWKGHTGKPEHWLFVANSDAFSKTANVLAKIALDDSQLVQAGSLSVDGDKVPLYALYYQNKIGLFAATAERMVFLSDAGMLLQGKAAAPEPLQLEAKVEYDADGKPKITPLTLPKAAKPNGKLISERADMVADLLSKRLAKQQRIAQGLLLEKPQHHSHTLYISPAFMTLSYQDAMRGLGGSRFDFDGTAWRQAVAVNAAELPTAAWNADDLYREMPHNAAFCANLPLNWQTLADWSAKLPTKSKDVRLAEFNAPLVACWYAGSPAAAPLFVTRLPQSEHRAEQLAAMQQMFDDLIGAKEYVNKQRFALQKHDDADSTGNERMVSARYGSHQTGDLPSDAAKQLSARRYFPVRYAVSGDYAWFSPNGDLVDNALAVHRRSAPALSEQIAAGTHPVMWINGVQSAKWLKEQADGVIAEDSDMRGVLQQRFTPKLRQLTESGSWQASVGQSVLYGSAGKTWQWQEVTWQQQP